MLVRFLEKGGEVPSGGAVAPSIAAFLTSVIAVILSEMVVREEEKGRRIRRWIRRVEKRLVERAPALAHQDAMGAMRQAALRIVY